VTKLAGRTASLSGGTSLTADLIVIGVGVRPSIALAEAAGLATDRASPSTNTCRPAPPASTPPATSRAGPIHTAASASASSTGRRRAPGPDGGAHILGRRERFDAVPFFWSQHYDMAISYVGHAARWDATKVEGSLADNDGTVTFSAPCLGRAPPSAHHACRAERRRRRGGAARAESQRAGRNVRATTGG